jgi:phage-related protein (TIGR01555 family)
LASNGGEDKIQKRAGLVNLLKSVYNLTLLDSEEEYDIKSPALGGSDIFMEKFYQFATGGGDLPYTRLMGVSPAGLNSTGASDIRNYYDGLKSRQSTKIRPALKYIDKIIMMHKFGRVIPEFKYEFNPLWQLSVKEQADTQYVEAQRDAIYLSNDVLPPSVIAQELQVKGTYAGIDDNLIAKVSEDFINKYDPANPERTPPASEGDFDLLNQGGEDDAFAGI